ncbi:hypothetical protein ACFE04_002231 [Oxalis oulophora]
MKFCECKNWSSIIQLSLILLSALIGIGLLVTGVIMSYKFGPQSHDHYLLIKLHSLSLSNLNLSDDSSLSTAKWDTKLLYANKGSMFEIYIQSQETVLCYNNQTSDPLSCASVGPISLGPKRQKLVEVMFNSSGCVGGQPYVGDEVVEEMKRDIGVEGSLHFKLEMDLVVVYRRAFLSWHYHLKPDCGDLVIKFQPETSNGLSYSPRVCLIPSSN